MKLRNKYLYILISLLLITSCKDPEPVYPKPLSGMKLSLPEKNYNKIVDGCTYSFKTPSYTNIDSAQGKCNLNINYTPLNATLFMTYIPIDTNLINHIEYSRKLVYEHAMKADEIREGRISNPKHNVYGLAYKLIGNSASSYQFYLTDSTTHFLRGALYFNVSPNYDSLKPFITYLMTDFDTLFQSLKWHNIDK